MGEQLYKGAGEFVPDALIADLAIPVMAKGIKVAKGEGLLRRGTLLGIGADGMYRRTGTAKGEGEDSVKETAAIGADCILADDVDAVFSDVVTTAYVSGTFNRAAVILPEGEDVAGHETELRRLGIFLKEVQDY